MSASGTPSTARPCGRVESGVEATRVCSEAPTQADKNRALRFTAICICWSCPAPRGLAIFRASRKHVLLSRSQLRRCPAMIPRRCEAVRPEKRGTIRPRAAPEARAQHAPMSEISQAPDSIDAVIQRCLAGDQEAWGQIVRQHWRKVFNIAYKFTGKHDEAEDLTQDVFLKIFKSLNTFDRRANFQTWLISISRNLCIDHYRSVRKERETVDRDVDAGELHPASGDLSPFVVLERSDRRELLRQALAALPATLRTAVLMRD